MEHAGPVDGLIAAAPLAHPVPDPHDDAVANLIRPAGEVERPGGMLVGVPFDTTTLGRRGSRFGPAAIRHALAGLVCYDAGTGVDLALTSPIADYGDVEVVQTDVAETWRRIADVVEAVSSPGVPLVVLGGDHGLTFPVVRGLARRQSGRLGLVSIDAHYDVRASQQGQDSAGVPIRRILEELDGFVDGRNVVEIGAGPWRNSRGFAGYLAERGARVISARELHRGSLEELVAEAVNRAADGTEGIWLTVDIDAVDAAYAPGTGTPAVAGLTSFQLLEIVTAVGAHPLALGIDVVEVAPHYDESGRTATLAATAILSFLAGRHASSASAEG